jgi:protease I
MSTELDGRRIAFLATDGVEQIELTDPWEAMKEAGAEPELISLRDGRIQGFNHLDKADQFDVHQVVAQADAERYDALVLPGGVANPDELRTDDDAVAFIRAFFDAGKPVAAICHAPWTLIEAEVVAGREVTSWPSLETDLTNAGAKWVDREVCVDRGLVTSRNPDDLPAFCKALVEQFAQAGDTVSR